MVRECQSRTTDWSAAQGEDGHVPPVDQRAEVGGHGVDPGGADALLPRLEVEQRLGAVWLMPNTPSGAVVPAGQALPFFWICAPLR